ncbi:MAG TPA: hypothetical protein VLT59_16390 [Steroidobacteraceae bacterium]|nr:hypothetical protein [Steroidobacteraceae bacterium]
MLLHPNLLLLFVLGMALLLTRLALGSDRPFIYPTAGQSEEQLAEDRFECHRAAVDHSGFDPVHAALRQPLPAGPVAVAVPPNEKEGATAVGVVTGAVAGGALGAATHNDPGEFAAVSAVLGGLIGGAVESEGARDAEGIATAEAEARMRDQQSQLAAREARKEAYRLAFAACMQGRGYMVR